MRKKNPYYIGSISTLIGATLLQGSANIFAAEELQPIAKKIDPSRCYWLEGKITAEGLCGEKLRPDMKRITAEAEQGNGLAAYRLGQIYSYGSWGIDRDQKKGVKWYKHAASLGFRHAQLKLGAMYEYGRGGVEENLKESLRWYEASTEHGLYPNIEDKIISLRKQLEEGAN